MRTTARHARNDRIVQLRARDWTLKKIAEEVGLSERHCARILEERKQTDHLKTNGPAEGTGMSNATATELLDRLQETVGDLAALVWAGPTSGLRAALVLELTRLEAERSIDELRRRSEEFAVPTAVTKATRPPFEADMS
jgi:AraC-like DNA-binding protein